jgi:hypothetical protein
VLAGGHPLEQRGLVAWLGAQDETQIKRLEETDVRTVGGERVFDDDRLKVRVLPAQIARQAIGGIALAVVFFAPSGLTMGSEAKGKTSGKCECAKTAPSIRW